MAFSCIIPINFFPLRSCGANILRIKCKLRQKALAAQLEKAKIILTCDIKGGAPIPINLHLLGVGQISCETCQSLLSKFECKSVDYNTVE